jgi:hypothetical protein
MELRFSTYEYDGQRNAVGNAIGNSIVDASRPKPIDPMFDLGKAYADQGAAQSSGRTAESMDRINATMDNIDRLINTPLTNNPDANYKPGSISPDQYKQALETYDQAKGESDQFSAQLADIVQKGPVLADNTTGSFFLDNGARLNSLSSIQGLNAAAQGVGQTPRIYETDTNGAEARPNEPLFKLKDNFAGHVLGAVGHVLQGVDDQLGLLTAPVWGGETRGFFSNETLYGNRLMDAKMGLVTVAAMELTSVARGISAMSTESIGNSGFRSIGDFTDAVTTKYQSLYDQGYSIAEKMALRGRIPNTAQAIGSKTDQFARVGLRDWLTNAEGIEEGVGKIIQVNRRLYDPSGSGAYRVPDVYIPGSQTILDGSISFKMGTSRQIIDFGKFSGGAKTTIITPSTSSLPWGSYGIVP